MIGDDGSEDDLRHSAALLRRAGLEVRRALDVGAGVGRVTRAVLLPVASEEGVQDESS